MFTAKPVPHAHQIVHQIPPPPDTTAVVISEHSINVPAASGQSQQQWSAPLLPNLESKIDRTNRHKRKACFSLSDVPGYLVTGVVLIPAIYLEAAEIRDGLYKMKNQEILGFLKASDEYVVQSIFGVYFAQNVWAFSRYTKEGLEKFNDQCLQEFLKIVRDRNGKRAKECMLSPAFLITAGLTISKVVIDGISNQYIGTEILKLSYAESMILAVVSSFYVFVTDGIETYEWIVNENQYKHYVMTKMLGIPITAATVLGTCLFSSQALSENMDMRAASVIGLVGCIGSAAYTWRVTADYLDCMRKRIFASPLSFLCSAVISVGAVALAQAYDHFNVESLGDPTDNEPFYYPPIIHNIVSAAGFSAGLFVTTVGSMLSTCCTRENKEEQASDSDSDTPDAALSSSQHEVADDSTPPTSDEEPDAAPSEDLEAQSKSVNGQKASPPKTNGKHLITASHASKFRTPAQLAAVAGEKTPLMNPEQDSRRWCVIL